MLEFLEVCVRARLNALISGGTGAGKTTLLNVLSGFISERERIVTIEDAAELQLHQEHVARLETRPPNVEGKGAIRQRQLLINALRMRPDRIVVGEVRGEEALDMLQAMNTGHDGSLTTVHANSPRDALTRVETMISMGSVNLPERAMRHQIASAIQIVVQQSRMSDGTRKVTSISEITGMEGDVITMQEIFTFEKLGRDARGQGYRAVPGHRRAAEGLRAAQGVGHPPAAGHVRRRHGGAIGHALLPGRSGVLSRRGARARLLLRRHQDAGDAAAAQARGASRGSGDGAGHRAGTPSGAPKALLKAAEGGPLPSVDRFVSGTTRGSALGRWIEQSGVKTSDQRHAAHRARATPLVFGFITMFLVKAMWGFLLGAMLGFALPFMFLNMKRTRRLRAFEETFP